MNHLAQRRREVAASEIIADMEKEVQRIMRTIQSLKRSVTADDLTGLYRRNEFFSRLNQILLESQGGEISLLLVDIDNFKQINDSMGHQAGDEALKRVAKVISRCSKAGATTGRYGGEEFIVALYGDEKAAQAMGEALRRQIAREVGITVSVGAASARQAQFEASCMVSMADKALYQAKNSGKNKVCLAA